MKFYLGTYLFALVAVACVIPHGKAKPPDLPIDPPIIYEVTEAVPAVVENAAPTVPDTAFLFDMPALPVYPWSCNLPVLKQLVDSALFFNTHPMMTLVPAETVNEVFGVETNFTPPPACCRAIQKCCPQQVVEIIPCMPRRAAVPTGCPYQPTDRRACGYGDPILTRTVLENLAALEKASEGINLARKLAQQGRTCEAFAVLEQARALVPGSGVETRVEDTIADIVRASADYRGGEQVAEDAPTCPYQVSSNGCCASFLKPVSQFGLCWMSQAGVWIAGKSCCSGETACKSCCSGGTACAASCCSSETTMTKPISIRVQQVMLQTVLNDLRDSHGIPLSIDVVSLHRAGITLCQPVTLAVENMPARTVLDILLQPFGLKAVNCGNAVCVTSTKIGCCCGTVNVAKGGCEGKCGQTPCCCTTANRSCCSEACSGQECCTKKAADRCRVSETCEKCPKSEEVSEPQSKEQSACPMCEMLHNTYVRIRRMRKEPGVEEQVRGLMKACYQALEQGLRDKAVELARQARALDPVRVEGDPVVFKMGLLTEKPTTQRCPAKVPDPSLPVSNKPSNNYPQPKPDNAPVEDNLSLRPDLPAVDTAVIAAFDGLLTEPPVPVAPKKSLTIGVGINSDAGLHGSIVINEKNFTVKDDAKSGSTCSKCKACKTESMIDQVGKFAKTMFHCSLPNEEMGNHFSVGCSIMGQLNCSCQMKHEGSTYQFIYRGGIPFVIVKPTVKTKKLTIEQ